MFIDLNCDMGEGCGNDAELMKYISSANIACGFHAGDVETMRRTVELAIAHEVAIGAHPGYRDRENFGRTAASLSRTEVVEIITEQIATLNAVCKEFDATLHHVKPHGALYNQAAKDRELAEAIAEAVHQANSELILYGLSGSYLISEAEARGLITASEVFADRTYKADGTLTPRSQPDALINKSKDAVDQALQMINSQTVNATTGETISIRADTLCIHGDGEHAVAFAKQIRRAFEASGIKIQPYFAGESERT
jgi:5-oxoprolinase (ATP-hydrolysing) subunit A